MLTHPSHRTAAPSICLSALRNTRRAFTLIELLVVISIIALLVAILLPALNAARTTAKAIQAGSQVRQLQIAVFAYANDYDDVLPPAADTVDGDNDDKPPYWSELLVDGKYINVERPAAEGPPDIFFSPDHVRSSQTFWKKQWFTTGFGAVNWGAMAQTKRWNLSLNPQFHAPPARQHDVRGPAPAKVLTLVDTTDKRLFDLGRGDGWYAAKTMFTYNGALARSYLDGHVSTGDSTQVLWKPTSQRTGEWMNGINLKTFDKEPWWGRHGWEPDPWE